MKQLVVLGLISAFLGLNSVSFAEDACCDTSSKTEATPSEPTAQVISNEESAVVAQEGAQEQAEEKTAETASVEAE